MPFFSRSSHSKHGRRRDDSDDVRRLSFDLESFEFVAAGEEVGLVRLAGRWIAPVERVLEDVFLVATVGGHSVDVTPLPDLEGAMPQATPSGEPWRAAFSLSSELALNEMTDFALGVGAGERVPLPPLGEFTAARVENEPEPPMEIEAELMAPAEPIDDELERVRAELEQVRTQLEVERRRHEALEEEIRSHTVLENDLRNAMALQEAELAAAVAQAAQQARRAERQRDRVVQTDAGEVPGRPVDADLVTRIGKARRAADAAA